MNTTIVNEVKNDKKPVKKPVKKPIVIENDDEEEGDERIFTKAYNNACRNDNYYVAEWLHNMRPEYAFVAENNHIIKYGIFKYVDEEDDDEY